MTKALIASLLILVGSSALAQDVEMPAKDLPQNGGAGLRTGHITASGATVPNPGGSQSGGVTPLDRGVQREDQKIESSICKGC